MTANKAMRIFTAVSVPAVKHPTRRRRTLRPRTGPAAVTLMLAGACTLMYAATTPVLASGPSPSPLSTLPVVVAPTPRPAVVSPWPAAAPTPLVLPVAPPAPRPAPVATSAVGAVQGIEATPGLLPPIAILPTPATPNGPGSSMVPLGLLAAFVATLLIATGLTARRRL
jgi:hypothetical protein